MGQVSGSVYSTESLHITEFVTSQEAVDEVDGIFHDFFFNDDFACISGQQTAAAIPDVLNNASFADHTHASFSEEDGNNENDFFRNQHGRLF